MDAEIKVAVITLSDQKEYVILDKINDGEEVYLFLFLKGEPTKVILRKYTATDSSGEIYKLKDLEEFAHAYELFFHRHPELKEYSLS